MDHRSVRECCDGGCFVFFAVGTTVALVGVSVTVGGATVSFFDMAVTTLDVATRAPRNRARVRWMCVLLVFGSECDVMATTRVMQEPNKSWCVQPFEKPNVLVRPLSFHVFSRLILFLYNHHQQPGSSQQSPAR
jgi:hypothetical protein